MKYAIRKNCLALGVNVVVYVYDSGQWHDEFYGELLHALQYLSKLDNIDSVDIDTSTGDI